MTEPKRWSVLLHGEPKVSDLTGLAETALGPRLFLDSGTNGKWLKTNTVEWNPYDPAPTGLGLDDTVVVLANDWDVVKAAVERLRDNDHEFRSLIFNDLTDMQNQAKWDITTSGMKIQDWGVLLDQMGPVVQESIDLLNHKTSPLWNVVIVVQAVEVKDRFVPALRGGVAPLVAAQVDTVGFLRPSDDMAPDGSVPDVLTLRASKAWFAGDNTPLKNLYPKGVPVPEQDLTSMLRSLQEDNNG